MATSSTSLPEAESTSEPTTSTPNLSSMSRSRDLVRNAWRTGLPSPFTWAPLTRMWSGIQRSLLQRPQEAITTSLTAFTIFQKLPPEIRHMIWKLVCKEARVIVIRDRAPRRGLPSARVPYISNNSSPAILQVNTESRGVGLNSYSLVSAKATQLQSYINFEVDIIYLDILLFNGDEDLLQWTHYVHWRHKIKYLALPTKRISLPIRDEWAWDDEIEDNFVEVAKQLDSGCLIQLKELILVDNWNASDSRMTRYLLPLQPNDVVKCYDELGEIPGEATSVASYLRAFKEEISSIADLGEVSVGLADTLSGKTKVMQLRATCKKGVDSTASKTAPETKASNGSGHKSIYLGKFQKVEDGWEIVRR